MLVALRPTDVRRIEILGVIFHIKSLPMNVKDQIINQSVAMTLRGNSELINYAQMARQSVKYGVCGWDNFKYDDGTAFECKLVDDPELKVKCLADECLEVLYSTNVFDQLATYTKDPAVLSKAILEGAVKLKKNPNLASSP